MRLGVIMALFKQQNIVCQYLKSMLGSHRSTVDLCAPLNAHLMQPGFESHLLFHYLISSTVCLLNLPLNCEIEDKIIFAEFYNEF